MIRETYDKAMYNMCLAYLNVKYKLEHLDDEEDGLETVETIILVAVAVIVAGVIINALTKTGFKRADDPSKECGLIEYIFSIVADRLSKIFNSNTQGAGT